MKAHIHYEKAFEDYLQKARAAYVAVDESRRAAFRDARLKSFDFIVYSPTGTNWLVDIKGRRWSPRGRPRPVWENWVTQADVESLGQWQEVFGDGFRAMFVFAYRIEPDADAPPEIVHRFRGDRYVFAGAALDDYALHARVRSPRWGTVNVGLTEFARIVQPFSSHLGGIGGEPWKRRMRDEVPA